MSNNNNTSTGQNCCSVCGRRGEGDNILVEEDEDPNKILNLLQCGRCHIQAYCGKECQKQDWPAHKKKCLARFSLAQLEDPNNKIAAKARNGSNHKHANQFLYGKTYEQIYGINLNDMVPDRICQCCPGASVWAEGVGDYYVSTDRAELFFAEESSLEAGQYYSTDFRATEIPTKWERFDSSAAAPGNVGGFHKAIIDTEQPNTKWTLSAKLVTTDILGYRLKGPAFIALAREDYRGFVSSASMDQDQCRGHFKIKEFESLTTGKFLIEDSYGSFVERTSRDGLVQVHGDGYYPVHIHRDGSGKIDLIMIQLMPLAKDSARMQRKSMTGELSDFDAAVQQGDGGRFFCACGICHPNTPYICYPGPAGNA